MGRRRYTEEQFREAVADPTVTTIAELCRRLGLVPRGGNYASLRELAQRLELDLDRVLASRPTRIRPGRWRHPWAVADLRAAIAEPSVDTIADVCHALGVVPRTEAYRRIRNVARERDIDISHLTGPRNGRPFEGLGIPVKLVVEAVRHSSTRDEALERLEITPTPRRRKQLARTIHRFGIPIAHLRPRPSTRSQPPGRPRAGLSELLVPDSYQNTSRLRQRLIEECVLPRRCSSCDLTRWQGEPIPLELDHVDGDRTNNSLENLRLLCPNCHALTPTYRGRNIGRR